MCIYTHKYMYKCLHIYVCIYICKTYLQSIYMICIYDIYVKHIYKVLKKTNKN